MQITEVLESANIYSDSKARRVLNTQPGTIPNISLDTLNNGVTIEQLESLNVPVYQYGTQITIHGKFANIDNDRVIGYKCLVVNQNKSLGVKYVAIDGQKKKLLSEVNRYADKTSKWSIHIDSQGCEAIRMFHSQDHANDKQRCIDCYNSTPDTLYIGGKRAASLMYGGYAVIVYIGAIYADKLWQLIGALTGINNQTEYDLKVAEYEKQQVIDNAIYEAKVQAAKAKRQAAIAEVRSNFKPAANWQPFNGDIVNAGIYAVISHSLCDSDPVLFVYKVKTHGKSFKMASKSFADFNYTDWQPTDYKIRDSKTINNGWQIMPEAVMPEVKAIEQVKPIDTVKPITASDKPIISMYLPLTTGL